MSIKPGSMLTHATGKEGLRQKGEGGRFRWIIVMGPWFKISPGHCIMVLIHEQKDTLKISKHTPNLLAKYQSYQPYQFNYLADEHMYCLLPSFALFRVLLVRKKSLNYFLPCNFQELDFVAKEK